ncbi:hypothetical protein [Pseudomonas sp. Irchel s3f7]|uniref:gp53-like domain-containing protein n=1 Tax=Pseudomonas sp. Irchel s3f7 TaxID=2009153 RepID=UPI0021145941|nr:hypothetical protein [Pseudomonas sp. Irchel s3f7]
MPWYKSGTVACTLNSTTVTGTGTAFAANARVGDAYLGPDGRWYEVANIASDTVLSILPAYLGATVAAGIYALAPMQGYTKESADTLRALVNQYGAILAALGTTGNYDILPPNKGGTGITDLSAYIQGLLNDPDASSARLTLGSAKSGANSDITSLTGLTTALSAALGGTGVTSIAALLAALQAAGAYGKSNAVGAVSQAGGIPTGAIVDTATNANGTYMKLLDGTMICHGQPVAGIDQTTTAQAYSANISLPAAFINAAYKVSVNSTGVNVTNVFQGYCRSNPVTTSVFQIVQYWNYVQTYTYTYIAIGRWF